MLMLQAETPVSDEELESSVAWLCLCLMLGAAVHAYAMSFDW